MIILGVQLPFFGNFPFSKSLRCDHWDPLGPLSWEVMEDDPKSRRSTGVRPWSLGVRLLAGGNVESLRSSKLSRRSLIGKLQVPTSKFYHVLLLEPLNLAWSKAESHLPNPMGIPCSIFRLCVTLW